VRLRRIPERQHEVVSVEQAVYGRPLHAFASSVDQPNHREPCFLRGVQIIVDDGDDIARLERVKVDRLFDGNFNRPGIILVHIPR